MSKRAKPFSIQHPVIFLDIDGVLNGTGRPDGHRTVHADCVFQFNRLLAASSAKVVISSIWRYMVHEGVMTVVGFRHMLASHGVRGCDVIGVTAKDEEVQGRGAQIENWRKRHRVKRYVVLDDVDLEITSNRHPLVKTDASVGLTVSNVEDALHLLNSQP